MLSLSILHNIHLNKKQIYDLHDGIDLNIIGICVPVWIDNKNTSEPAKEVFCNYCIKNTKEEIPIKILNNGFEITLPFRSSSSIDVNDDEFLYCLKKNKLENLYKNKNNETSSKNLLDISYGGSKFLTYGELNTVIFNDETIDIFHNVIISSVEYLLESLS